MRKNGALYSSKDHSCLFSVWAPEKESMQLLITHPFESRITMVKDYQGYFSYRLEDTLPGCRYLFCPDNGEHTFPDPASDFQPDGVHGPSEVIDHSAFRWSDSEWKGVPFRELIFYELHVGTFTTEGTFEAIIPRLDELAETGINAIELMPVCQFPGNRNWGYDGVYPYSVQNSYGGPQALKRLVNACHQKGIAIFLDVVYNHLGPEGNYLSCYGPYFTDQYSTPWGHALNFDGPWSDGVKDFFSDNPLHWFRNYHIDGLRLDAIHAIFDSGAKNFWEVLSEKVTFLQQQLGRVFYLVAECDYNSPKVVRPTECGGLGFDAQWLDDFHHALYVLLDEKGRDRYIDFGRMEQLAKAYTDGFVHSGEYVKARRKKHGVSSAGVPGDKFIVFNQNHDQVGNRVMGERLSVLVNFERLKLAAGALFLSPYLPLLFMGEEYAETSPFFYFVSHSEEDLIKAVQEGRKKEFESFNWKTDPPDPQNEDTFNRSKLNWAKRQDPPHSIIRNWHKELIRLRREHPILRDFNKNNIRTNVIDDEVLVLIRQNPEGNRFIFCLLNFSEREITYTLPASKCQWSLLLNSTDKQWMSPDHRNTPQKESSHLKENAVPIPPLGVIVLESGHAEENYYNV